MAHNDFDKLVKDIYDAGIAWVEAKLEADQLDADLKPYLASIKNSLDDGKTSETKLERLALGSKEYRTLAVSVQTAAAQMLRKKVRYESLQCAFEAKRSQGALLRAQIEKGIFHRGG